MQKATWLKSKDITSTPLLLNFKQKSLFVSTSVEYDLPDHIIPPKNAGDILAIDFSNMEQNKKTPSRNSCSSKSLGPHLVYQMIIMVVIK